MLKAEDVPEAAWHALKRFVLERPYGYDYREAIAAALEAWPGKHFKTRTVWKDGIDIEVPTAVILPITEPGNADPL